MSDNSSRKSCSMHARRGYFIQVLVGNHRIVLVGDHHIVLVRDHHIGGRGGSFV